MAARPSRLCLFLSLLASLWASGIAPAAAGEMRFVLSSEAVSSLPMDLAEVAERICGPKPQPRPPFMAKCHPIAKNNGGVSTQPRRSGGDGTSLTVWARTLWLESAEGVVTSCGIWDATVILDPALSQPNSTMVLEELPEDPERGVFAGVLEMSTILHLANRETGQTADFSLRLGLGLAGPWVVTSPGDSPVAGNLLLLADRRGGELVASEQCGPVRVLESSDDLKGLEADDCQICLTGVIPQPDDGTGGSLK